MTEKLSGKKIVMIVAQEYEDIELLHPLLRLSEEGAEIIVVPVLMGNHPRPWLENKPVTGRYGHPVPIPIMPEGRLHRIGKIEELQASAIDCLFFPGGFSPDALRRHPPTLELTRQCHQQGKVIAAICHAPWILISAGLMKGKRATSFAAVKDDLINAGAVFVDEPVVRDGNIITSRTPLDLTEFCLEIIRALTN